jgi:predicted acetyltransferase
LVSAADLIPQGLRLEPASAARLDEYLAMIDLALALGETGTGYNLTVTAIVRRDPQEHLRRLGEMERGQNLPEGWVPMSTRWLIDESNGVPGRLVGEARIRHGLSPSLEIEGGHVGYFIHPNFRGRGYGKAILRLALRELAALGIARVLVTCNADNQRSRRVIEGAGGLFDRYTVSPKSGKQVMRFWIANEVESVTPGGS